MSDPAIHARQLAAAGQVDAALEMARHLVMRSPADAAALHVLGDLLMITGDLGQAERTLERAAQSAPASAPIRHSLGMVLVQLARFDRAVAELNHAVRLAPDYAPAYGGLVAAHGAAYQADMAIGVGRDAAARFPGDESIARQVAASLLGAGLASEAVATLRRTRQARGNSVALQSLLVLAINYADDANADEAFREHAELGRMIDRGAAPSASAFANTPDPERPLRIAYLSPAFCNHSAGHFILPLLEHHDRSRFEVFCCNACRRPDEMTAAMRSLAEGWLDTMGMVEAQVAAWLRAERIDIAVDLAGHTGGSLLRVLCHGAAPVQGTYLGYPNTTALGSVGFRLVDHITDPAAAERLATERLVRLEPCFVCYAPPAHAPACGREPPCCHGPVTFGSFNTNAKLTNATLDLWAQILRAVPGARLFLKNLALADPSLARMRRDQLGQRGVRAEALELLGETPSKGEHMGQYDRVDIALDPIPYNGTTTTAEALWMGVPVVAMAGDRHLSRVGASLLAAVGLADLIASDASRYVETAVAIAADRERLRLLRAGLRERVRSSPLCDGPAFTRRLECAYVDLWRDWCRSPDRNGSRPAAR